MGFSKDVNWLLRTVLFPDSPAVTTANGEHEGSGKGGSSGPGMGDVARSLTATSTPGSTTQYAARKAAREAAQGQAWEMSLGALRRHRRRAQPLSTQHAKRRNVLRH
jgi:hypothetical protein